MMNGTKDFPSKPQETNKQTNKLLKESLIPEVELVIRKRLPRSLPRDLNDVYITKRTPFKVQLDRCQTLLDSGEVVFVHGLGAAVSRAINVALAVKKNNFGSVDFDVRTSTVNLVDDLDYKDEDRLPGVQLRPNSAIHIKLFRPEIPVPVKA